jgi:propanol-preferring alcohol dehydrogenase
VIVGLFGGKATVPLASLPLRPISIIGSYVGRLDEARELITLMRAGGIPVPPIQERPLDQANAAIDDLRAGKVLGRVVLKP